MKKLFGTLLFSLAFALCLPAFALADMASLPSLALTYLGLPLLIISLAICAVSVLIKAMRKRREAGKGENMAESNGEDKGAEA